VNWAQGVRTSARKRLMHDSGRRIAGSAEDHLVITRYEQTPAAPRPALADVAARNFGAGRGARKGEYPQ
jgi:hypothetical protein